VVDLANMWWGWLCGSPIRYPPISNTAPIWWVSLTFMYQY